MAERTSKVWRTDADVTPEVAFTYLCDVQKHAEWSPKPYRVDPAPELPLREGSTFRSYGKAPGDDEHANQVEVTVLQAPRVLVLTSTDRGEHFVHRFEVTPSGSGVTITRTVEAPQPRGVMRLAFPLIFVMLISPDVRKGMQLLKRNLESLT